MHKTSHSNKNQLVLNKFVEEKVALTVFLPLPPALEFASVCRLTFVTPLTQLSKSVSNYLDDDWTNRIGPTGA